MKPQKDKNDKKDTDIAAGSSLGLSIGLSLGVFFGIVTDNLGLCMMIGVAVGLCGGWAVGALRRRRKEAKDEEKNEK